MKVSIDKRNDDDILYQGSIIEFEFNDSLNKLFGTIAFPELNKGECVEMELICELKIKTEKCE